MFGETLQRPHSTSNASLVRTHQSVYCLLVPMCWTISCPDNAFADFACGRLCPLPPEVCGRSKWCDDRFCGLPSLKPDDEALKSPSSLWWACNGSAMASNDAGFWLNWPVTSNTWERLDFAPPHATAWHVSLTISVILGAKMRLGQGKDERCWSLTVRGKQILHDVEHYFIW